MLTSDDDQDYYDDEEVDYYDDDDDDGETDAEHFEQHTHLKDIDLKQTITSCSTYEKLHEINSEDDKKYHDDEKDYHDDNKDYDDDNERNVEQHILIKNVDMMQAGTSLTDEHLRVLYSNDDDKDYHDDDENDVEQYSLTKFIEQMPAATPRSIDKHLRVFNSDVDKGYHDNDGSDHEQRLLTKSVDLMRSETSCQISNVNSGDYARDISVNMHDSSSAFAFSEDLKPYQTNDKFYRRDLNPNLAVDQSARELHAETKITESKKQLSAALTPDVVRKNFECKDIKNDCKETAAETNHKKTSASTKRIDESVDDHIRDYVEKSNSTNNVDADCDLSSSDDDSVISWKENVVYDSDEYEVVEIEVTESEVSETEEESVDDENQNDVRNAKSVQELRFRSVSTIELRNQNLNSNQRKSVLEKTVEENGLDYKSNESKERHEAVCLSASIPDTKLDAAHEQTISVFINQ